MFCFIPIIDATISYKENKSTLIMDNLIMGVHSHTITENDGTLLNPL